MARNSGDTIVGIFDERGEAKQAANELRQAGFTENQIDYSDPGEGGGGGSARITLTVQAGDRYEEAANILRRHGASESGEVAGGMAPYDPGGHTTTSATTVTTGEQIYDDDAARGTITTGEQLYGDEENARGAVTSGPIYGDDDHGDDHDTTRETGRDAGHDTGQGAYAGTAGRRDIDLSANEGAQRIELREEELTASKQQVQAGEVQVRKTVQEEQREIPVNLRHEEVTIERRAVDRPLREGEVADLSEEVIQVPIYEERAQVQKQARVAEEVVIDKNVVQEQETLRGTVRREDLDIERSGDVDVRGSNT